MKKKLLFVAVAFLALALTAVLFASAREREGVERLSSTPEITAALAHTAEPTAPPELTPGLEPTPAPTPTSEARSDDIVVVDENGNEIQPPDVDQTGGWVAQYTGIDTNKQSLVKLVRTTLYGMNYVFTETLRDVEEASFLDGTLGNLLRCLKDGAQETDKLAEKWPSVKEKNKMVGINLPGEYAEWTVGDWAAAAGNWFFMQGSRSFEQAPKNKDVPYMKQCVLHQVFLADVNNDLSDWELQGVVDKQYGGYDVNYALDFKWNETKYRALIGNRDMEYLVLDVVPEGYVYGTTAGSDDKNPIPATIPVEAKSNTVTVDNGGNVTVGDKTPVTTSKPQPTQSAPPALYQAPSVIPNNTVPPADDIQAIEVHLPDDMFGDTDLSKEGFHVEFDPALEGKSISDIPCADGTYLLQ